MGQRTCGSNRKYAANNCVHLVWGSKKSCALSYSGVGVFHTVQICTKEDCLWWMRGLNSFYMKSKCPPQIVLQTHKLWPRKNNKKMPSYMQFIALDLNHRFIQAVFLLCILCIMNRLSTDWLGSHFHAACVLALSCRFSSRFHSSSVWRLRFLAIWRPSLCLLRCHHITCRASGGGWVSVWCCLVTVSPDSPLVVDMCIRAAYCRPDVGTHLQLTLEEVDKGPFCPDLYQEATTACYPTAHDSDHLFYLGGHVFGCRPTISRMHELSCSFFVCLSWMSVINRKWRTEGCKRCGE